MALAPALGGCFEERSTGKYFDAATIVAPAQPDDRSSLSTGNSFVVDLTQFRKPRVPAGPGALRQTDVRFELSERPQDGRQVALATVRSRYEYGGNSLSWVSETARGTLQLETRAGKPFVTVAATFDQPLLGTGARTYAAEIELSRSTRSLSPSSAAPTASARAPTGIEAR